MRADIQVGGVAASVRLTFERPGSPSVRLLAAEGIDELLALKGRQESGSGVHVAAAAGPKGAKALIDRFMLERLALSPVSVWRAEPGAPKDAEGNRDSVEDVHRWASFFYTVALNSGNDSVLLGPTTTGLLPVRLMQIFLDVPYVAELTQLTTATRKDAQEDNRVVRRAREDDAARQEQIKPLRKALGEAEASLSELRSNRPDLGDLMAAADATAGRMAACQADFNAAQEQYAVARKNRLADQRRVRRAAQSDAARLLLGALDPEACPRCDHAIEEDRRTAEDTQHVCSICTNPLPEVEEDPHARAEMLSRLQNRAATSLRTEETASNTVRAAASALATHRTAYGQAVERLEHAQSSQWHADVEKVQMDVYKLQGALSVATRAIGTVSPSVDDYLASSAELPTSPPDVDDDIIAAAIGVLTEIVASRSRELFAELNEGAGLLE